MGYKIFIKVCSKPGSLKGVWAVRIYHNDSLLREYSDIVEGVAEYSNRTYDCGGLSGIKICNLELYKERYQLELIALNAAILGYDYALEDYVGVYSNSRAISAWCVQLTNPDYNNYCNYGSISVFNHKRLFLSHAYFGEGENKKLDELSMSVNERFQELI